MVQAAYSVAVLSSTVAVLSSTVAVLVVAVKEKALILSNGKV